MGLAGAAAPWSSTPRASGGAGLWLCRLGILKTQPEEKDVEVFGAQCPPVFSTIHICAGLMLGQQICVWYSPGKGTSELEQALPSFILFIFNISHRGSALQLF